MGADLAVGPYAAVDAQADVGDVRRKNRGSSGISMIGRQARRARPSSTRPSSLLVLGLDTPGVRLRLGADGSIVITWSRILSPASVRVGLVGGAVEQPRRQPGLQIPNAR